MSENETKKGFAAKVQKLFKRHENRKTSYISARESSKISRKNRKITNVIERRRKRKNVPEEEYITVM
ncbi:MAG TPA: hypothetical protein P5058_06520, partial [Eubacteriales bacterium]|nr:hypothetical protein [Eubacteriales bacterium]